MADKIKDKISIAVKTQTMYNMLCVEKAAHPYGPVAQLVERSVRIREVKSSSLSRSTNGQWPQPISRIIKSGSRYFFVRNYVLFWSSDQVFGKVRFL